MIAFLLFGIIFLAVTVILGLIIIVFKVLGRKCTAIKKVFIVFASLFGVCFFGFIVTAIVDFNNYNNSVRETMNNDKEYQELKAQKENLNGDITQLESDINEAIARKESLETDIKKLEKNKEQLECDNNVIQSELNEHKQQQNEILDGTFTLSAGTYIVGEDIAEGKYDITVLTGVGELDLYESYEVYLEDKYDEIIDYDLKGENSSTGLLNKDIFSTKIQNFRITDGQCFTIESGLELQFVLR